MRLPCWMMQANERGSPYPRELCEFIENLKSKNRVLTIGVREAKSQELKAKWPKPSTVF
jgi:hypothetical protein